MKPQNFYVSCFLKAKEEEFKKKSGGGRAGLFEPYFANASSSRWLQQLVPSCNSPHTFAGPAINLLQTAACSGITNRAQSLGSMRLCHDDACRTHRFPPDSGDPVCPPAEQAHVPLRKLLILTFYWSWGHELGELASWAQSTEPGQGVLLMSLGFESWLSVTSLCCA